MALRMVCPCGHSAPLPEVNGKYTCSKCQRKLELVRLGGPHLWEQWMLWVIRSGRLLTAESELLKIEYRKEEETGELYT